MKTAISIDDRLLREADETAERLGLSRSRLFALAVGDFLRVQRQQELLIRLNRVYANGPDAEEMEIAKNIRSKFRPAEKEKW
jgi:metal-responsive CopG/Arc/MetJ family transcriptional regulator